MFLRDNINLATRNFKTRKLRTFLTVLGIAVGIGTILFLVSLGYGLQIVLLEKIAKSDALLTLDVAASSSQVLKINKQVIKDLSEIPNVIEISPVQIVMSQIKTDDVTSNVKLSAVDSTFFRLGGIEFMEGKKYENKNDPQIVLSTGALASLGIEDPKEAIGSQVDVTIIIPEDATQENQGQGSNDLVKENGTSHLDGSFQVIGVVDDLSEASGYIPSGWVIDAVPDYFDAVKVKISDQRFLEDVRSIIAEKGYAVLALTDTVDQANKIFYVIQIILAFFGIVALAVSAIGMFNTMTIALLERTNEIGIMKAIGASRREILLTFVTESLMIGFLGGMGGITIGLVSANFINFSFNLLARNMGGQEVDIFYTPLWFIIFIVLFSTIVGFLTGIYPATRAAKLNPLVALRNK